MTDRNLRWIQRGIAIVFAWGALLVTHFLHTTGWEILAIVLAFIAGNFFEASRPKGPRA